MFFNISAIIYFFACVLSVFHLAGAVREPPPLAVIFTTSGFIIQTAGLIFRTIESGHAPFVSLYESVIYFSWAIILFYLCAQFKYRIFGLDIFVIPLALLALIYAKTLSADIQPLAPILQSVWLEIHVAVIFIGYAGLAVAYCCALIYLLKFGGKVAFLSAALNICTIVGLIFYFLLKIKFDRSIMTLPVSVGGSVFVCYLLYRNVNFLRGRFPSLGVLNRMNYKSVSYGFVFLTGGIVTGAVWANEAWGSYWSWDPKETWSLVAWLVYVAYFHLRKISGWAGKSVYITVYGFWAVMFTYFGVHFLLPGLHSYW